MLNSIVLLVISSIFGEESECILHVGEAAANIDMNQAVWVSVSKLRYRNKQLPANTDSVIHSKKIEPIHTNICLC